MNQLILAYARLSFIATLYCMGVIIQMQAGSKKFEECAKAYKELTSNMEKLEKAYAALVEL